MLKESVMTDSMADRLTRRLFPIYEKKIEIISYLYAPFMLFVRVWIAKVFFMSGLTKIDNWENTLILFEYEYAVPLLPVAFAAYSATFFELAMPVLLVGGLMARSAALPLLVMTAVIEFTYLSNPEHVWWAVALGLIMIKGAGPLSLDYLALRYFRKKAGA